MAKGPKTEWLFRYKYQKPGGEEEHACWVRWLAECARWPTEDELSSGVYQLLMPKVWRRVRFRTVDTVEQFWDITTMDRYVRPRLDEPI